MTVPAAAGQWRLAARLARRELRTGFSGFRIFLACLFLGVAAIAIVGTVSDALVEGLRAHGHRHALPLDSERDLAHAVRDLAAPGDLVVCLGAGNITAWANALPQQLSDLLDAGGRTSPGAGS